ncbi:CaiB/BaiF CoA-transferase family protein [Sphingomonas immobilis]|uniref:CoA transferase n=1 Tax=Sphingomonas immobilis TaxID=3063997 RepID=A0ABT8ZWW3_9SPHN|nr:CoA transferase [Sphingomonas sp. CA1-15]MDO7841758.1 CoA transferase [Sphingomonas sp. CA1-15]
MTERPLNGVRVLDAVSGPMAAIARHFAELGADVVRVEPTGGGEDRREGLMAGGVSLDFVAANLGKRTAPVEQLAALAVETDILIAPLGSTDVVALRAANPALVVLSVSDFGDTDGYRDWVGSGPVYHALSGELSRSGIPGREPLPPPGYLALTCAAVQAAYVALLAYYNALKTGHGDHLDFSTLDGASQALDPGYGIAGSATAGVPASQLPRGRAEARHQYPIIPCKDGFVRLCVLAARQWRGMFEWMGRPEAFADPSYDLLQTRFASPTLIPAITRFFADKTRYELEEAGQRFGVPTAAVLDLDEALQSEQMIARKAFVPVEIAAGVLAPLPDGVLEIDGVRMGIDGPAPEVPSGPIAWAPRSKPARPEAGGDRPLSGLRVLDFGVIVVGAEGGRLLADQGADVIKVENAAFPDGSRQNRTGGLISPTFATGHRNKRSLALNVRDPEGKALLLKLIETTDVLLSNFKGGTLESLGLDYASLKAVNPRIIVTDSSAFGPTGPWSKRLGYGPLVRASAGLTMQWRYPGEPDSFSDAITVYPDHVAGRIGVIGVLALMIRRLQTGKGGSVSVSQAEVMLSHMAPRIAADALERSGHVVTEDPAQSAVYPCHGDDEWCVVTIRDQADMQAVATVTGGVPLAEWLAGQAPREAAAVLQTAGVPAGAMLRVSELPGFDYYEARHYFREVTHPHMKRAFKVETTPIVSERLPDPPERPAPLMGEHSAKILREDLRLSDAEIERLIAANVLEQFKMPEETAA